MATSGTYAFALQADDLVTEAWERCGLNTEVLTDRHAASAMRSLYLALLGWTNKGLNLWQVDRVTAAAVVGAGSLTTALATTDVLEVLCTAGGQDLLLAPMGRDRWMAIPNKAQPGRPTQYWTERLVGVPVLHLWPVPDAAYSITYSRIRLPQDLSALQQTADAPALWLDALSAELARRIAGKWAPARLGDLTAEAATTFADAAGENRERVPLRIVPRVS